MKARCGMAILIEKPHRPFTLLEQRFIEEFTGGEHRFKRTKSALAAGYSKNTAYAIGSALLKKPHILEAIESRMDELAERCAVSVETITKQLYDAYELAMCGAVDRGADKPAGMATASPAAAVTALMSIAKLHGLITDKQELTGKNGAPLLPGKMLIELVDPTDPKGPDTP